MDNEEALEYFNGDTLAANVFISKYALRDKNGQLLEKTPDDMIRRLTKEFVRIENNYPNPLSEDIIYNLLKDFKFLIPSGSVQYGVGNNYSYSSLGNCFVIDQPEDSYGGILKTDQEQVQLMKRRGGVGFDLSTIRPNGSSVTNAAGSSTGVVSFMHRYSNSTREVGQNNRRGALILTINVSHPDAEEFVTAKNDIKNITGANISVKITNNFMEAVENNATYDQHFEFKDGTIKTINVDAKSLWKKIIHQIHKSAEPGILFWDNIINESPADCYEEFQTVSTNPCGEINLSSYDSCRLLHINLYNYIENKFTNSAYFNFEKFTNDTRYAQRLLDDIVDLEDEKIVKIINKIANDPESNEVKLTERKLWEKILESLRKGRRTGLGVLGEADMLAALGYKYGTDKANNFAEEVHKILAVNSYKESIQMAKERGSFPVWNFEKEYNNPFLNRIFEVDVKLYGSFGESDSCIDYQEYGRRNISNLTIAPTGTTSLMAQTSSGIEPVFRIHHKRKRKVTFDNPNAVYENGDYWEYYDVYHKPFEDWLSTIHKIDNPYNKATAEEINYNKKIEMQGKIQRFIDHSISITHNLPRNTSIEEVERLAKKAHQWGCKGFTIYREGSRDSILSSGNEEQNFYYNTATKRPKEVKCDILRPQIHGKEYVVLVGMVEEKPYEIFAFLKNGVKFKKDVNNGILSKRKRGIYDLLTEEKEILVEDIAFQFSTPEQEDITRLLSWGFRHGGSVKFAVEQLSKSYGNLMDYSKVIARQLKKYIPDDERVSGKTCPQCKNETLIYQSGCEQCTNCGYSACG